MPSILKQDKKSVLKRRNVSHLSINIETVQENKVSFAQSNSVEIDTETRNESFFFSIWPVIYVAQYMGFMPIQGIQTGDPSKFEFRWKTFRVMITMWYFVCSASASFTYLYRISRLGISAKNFVGFVFYFFCLFCGLFFLFLAQKWKDLALMWHRCEKIFLNLPYKECGWRLSTKIRITTAIILFFAIVDRSLAEVNNVHNFHAKVIDCNATITDKWKYFFLNEYPHIFMVLPYNFLFTILIQWAVIAFTFGWNYMDTFIMLTSIGLATRFKQINQRLEEMKNDPMDESLWAEIRHHYVLLCELVETVDKNLAAITLLCCTNDLYFICYQLLNVFNNMPHFINFMYFWYSLLYLIGRTTGVFLIASSINDAANYPSHANKMNFNDYIRALNLSCRNYHCSTDIKTKFDLQAVLSFVSCGISKLERFGDQISTQLVALSGMKFFFITRSLLFGMAGTIVTYELVLLQFDETSSKKSANATMPLCDIFLK